MAVVRGRIRLSTADRLEAAAAVSGLGLFLSGIFFFVDAQESQSLPAIRLVNRSGSEVVVEIGRTDRLLLPIPDGRSKSIFSSIDRTGDSSRRCIRNDQRLLTLSDGVELERLDRSSRYFSGELEPSDYEEVHAMDQEWCFGLGDTWIEWDGARLKKVGAPGISGLEWLLIATAGMTAACVAGGVLRLRHEETNTAKALID